MATRIRANLLTGERTAQLVNRIAVPELLREPTVRFFDDGGASNAAVGTITEAIAAGLPRDASVIVPTLHFPLDLLKPPVGPPISEPFLWMRVTWADGTEVVFGELDRATGARNLEGRILEVGAIQRRLSTYGDMQRATAAVVLEDLDRTLRDRGVEWYFATIEFRIGYRELPEDRYTRIPVKFRVDRIDDATEGRLSLSLIDAAADLALVQIEPAVVGDVLDHDWFLRSRKDADAATYIPIPYGDEMYQAPFAATAKATNPVLVVILGASRNPTWETPHFYGGQPWPAQTGTEPLTRDWEIWTPNYNAEGGLTTQHLVPIISTAPSASGILPHAARSELVIRVEVLKRKRFSAGVKATDEDWYYAILTVANDPTRHQGQLSGHNRRAIDLLKRAADAGEIFVRTPGYGAEGKDCPRDPISIAERCMRDHAPDVAQRFTQVSDGATAPDMLAARVGGTITEPKSVLDVLNEISRSYGLDLYSEEDPFTHETALVLRPRLPTAADRTTWIPAATTFTEDEIVGGSWRQWTPVGEMRHGFATHFRFAGVKEHAKRVDPNIEKTVRLVSWGAEGRQDVQYIRDAELGWVTQDPNANELNLPGSLLPTFSEAHTMASATVHLGGALVQLSRWVRITHRVASASGWTDRLCRVEAWLFDWQRRVVMLELLDADEHDPAKVYTRPRGWLLDDERNWIRLAARHSELEADPGLGVRLKDPLRWPEVKVGMILRVGLRAARVLTEPGLAGWIQLSTNVVDFPVTLSSGWELQHSHVAEPDALLPAYAGRSVPGAYFRLCDEALEAIDGSVGAFTDGAPAPGIGRE